MALSIDKVNKYKKRLLLRCIHHFQSDLINIMDHMCISGTEHLEYWYSKAWILRTRIIRIHAYNEVISIPRQNPFKMIRKNEG